jgi:hypothetical protein
MAFATVSALPRITMSFATILFEVHRVQHRRLPAPEIVGVGQPSAAGELLSSVPLPDARDHGLRQRGAGGRSGCMRKAASSTP